MFTKAVLNSEVGNSLVGYWLDKIMVYPHIKNYEAIKKKQNKTLQNVAICHERCSKILVNEISMCTI